MTERRYDDEEVREILGHATRSTPEGAGPLDDAPKGLTLPELQEIGAEAGIPPARIAAAARELDGHALAPRPRSLLGVRRSVARIVPLDRPLDDEEWSRLVAQLRQTFGAVGRIHADGMLRSWSNGNLQAHVEPSAEGWQLRMQTLKGDAAALAGIGAVGILFGVLVVILTLFGDMNVRARVLGAVFMAAGAGQLGYLSLALPRWADEREAQMEAIARKLPLLLEK